VETEVATGLDDGHTSLFGENDHVRLKDQYAAYAVGYLPITHNTDVFARVGYCDADSSVRGAQNLFDQSHSAMTYGGGAQYFFGQNGGGPNGVRLDYTRMDYGVTKGDSDVWSLAYVRKF
jgi:hypothetical protein